MAILNELPKLNGGKDAGITYIGVGWSDTNSSGAVAMADRLYIDNEYWTKNGGSITCQKSFDALIIIMQGCASDNSGNAFRSLYNSNGDIAKTPTGNFTQDLVNYHFSQGETVTGWQQNYNNILSVGAYIILNNE